MLDDQLDNKIWTRGKVYGTFSTKIDGKGDFVRARLSRVFLLVEDTQELRALDAA